MGLLSAGLGSAGRPRGADRAPRASRLRGHAGLSNQRAKSAPEETEWYVIMTTHRTETDTVCPR